MSDKSINKILGTLIRKHRKKLGLTQEQLAERVSLSTNFIGMVERGERNTKFANVYKLIYALDTNFESFFKGL